MFGSFASKGISIISSIILARYLVEEDYGAMVYSAIFAGLITQIGGMGYEIYYLQYKGNEQERRNILEQVYNLRLATNLILFVAQLIVGMYFSFFTQNVMSGRLLILLSFSILLEGFNSPQETLLKDKMEFTKITIGNLFKELFSGFGKVITVFFGFGAIAFGVGPLLGSAVRMIYLRNAQSYRHEFFKWNKNEISRIFSFGKHMLFGSAAMYVVQQIDRIFLSFIFPSNLVGRYGFAWGNASMPFNYLIMPQSQLTLTVISKTESHDRKLFEKLNLLSRGIMLMFIPLTIIGIYFNEEIIWLLFSDNWISASNIVRVLLVYYLILSVTFPYAYLLTGLGYPNLTSKITIWKAAVLVISLCLFSALCEADLILYTLIFVSVSIVFELIKMFKGIIKLQVIFYDIIMSMKLEIIMILMIIFFLFLITIFNSFGFRFFSGLILVVLYSIFFFFIDCDKSLESIRIISPGLSNWMKKVLKKA